MLRSRLILIGAVSALSLATVSGQQAQAGPAVVPGHAAAGAAVRSEALSTRSNGWVSVSTGDDFSCGTGTDGTLWCWGDNAKGQLGSPGGLNSDVALQVGVDTDWSLVAAGGAHACALRTDDTAWCWGWNFYGQVGVGHRKGYLTPVQVGTATWTAIAAGGSHSCGVQTGGTAWCWGDEDVRRPRRRESRPRAQAGARGRCSRLGDDVRWRR